MIDHIASLKNILGNQYVLTDDNDKAGFEEPWRGDKGRAVFVLCPKDSDELSKVVAYLVTNKISFVTQSGNTGLVGASTPDQSGEQAVLSLRRLNKILEINVANKSACVGAGVTLSMLNQAAAEHGLFFPIDLGADPCIGGIVATNTGGSRLLKYGDVRQNLLGLEIILLDNNGTILDMRNALHKNNTGMDLKQIFVGTGGQNGVILECVVKLYPLPKQSATAFLIPFDSNVVVRLLIELEKRFGDALSAFEGMSGKAIEAAFMYNGSGIKNSFNNGIPDYVCLLELNRTWVARKGEISLDEVMQLELSNIMENDKSLLSDVLLGRSEEHWGLRHAISEGVQKSGKLVGFDISFERDESIKFLNFIRLELPKHYPNINICDFGHIGDGAMHLNLVIPPDDVRLKNPKFIPKLRNWVFARVVKDFGGSYSAEHGLGPTNQAAYEEYSKDVIKEMVERVKSISIRD